MAAAIEVTRWRRPVPEVDVSEEGEAEEIEIEFQFRRKLAGLRFMPRLDRPHARRAAREWRTAALKALREKRATARYARRMLRRLQTPEPC
jgi:hypothetical protein